MDWKNKEERKIYMHKYYEDNKEKALNENKKIRRNVLNIISGNNPHCVKCGCNDIRLLEINHKNGGGTKERREISTRTFYWDVYKRRRKINDLELLCRICNSRHYLELKYGKLPYKIFYKTR